MKILVCGDREWLDEKLIRKRLCKFPKGTILIHGAARGADMLAGAIGRILGFAVMPFPADWVKYGKAAGAIRNRAMLLENPDLVIAFHDNLEQSKGTRDCIKQAGKRGIKVEIISHEETKVLNGGLFSFKQ